MQLLKKLKIILHSKAFFVISIFLVCLYTYLITSNYESKYQENEEKIVGTILSFHENGNQIKIMLEGKERVMVFYYAKELEELEQLRQLKLGDQIKVTGSLKEPETNRNFHLFSYQKYLKGRRIFWIMNASTVEFQKGATGFYILKNWMKKRISKLENTEYLKAFLFGDSASLEWKSIYQELGISHLFAVSGMHLSFFATVLFSILNRILKKEFFSFGIVSIVLGIYVWLLLDSASANRAFVFFLLIYANKYWKWNFTSLQILVFTFCLLLLKNPFFCYQIGFQFSFIICFFLLKQPKKDDSYIKTLLETSLVSSLASFPLSVFYFHQFHFGSVFFNMIAVPFVSFLLFPLSLFTFCFPILTPILCFFISIFHGIISFLEQFSFLKITFCVIPIWYLFIYYSALLLTFFISKKFLIVFFVFLLCHFFAPYCDSNYWIDMIDIGQGDAILIRAPHLKYTILIDTGGKMEYEEAAWKKRDTMSQTDTILLPYVKSLGISKIDLLILTHGDSDHVGNALTLIQKFSIGQVVLNSYFDQPLEEQIIKELKKKSIAYQKILKQEVRVGKDLFHFIGSTSEQENEDSLIFYTNLGNWNILFMGDAGKITENKILEEYNLPKMDILKVGHHGSKNSTSAAFLEKIDPTIALISAGVKNRFGHPNLEVIKRLEKQSIMIYQTNEQGGIRVKMKDTIKVKTCLS